MQPIDPPPQQRHKLEQTSTDNGEFLRILTSCSRRTNDTFNGMWKGSILKAIIIASERITGIKPVTFCFVNKQSVDYSGALVVIRFGTDLAQTEKDHSGEWRVSADPGER